MNKFVSCGKTIFCLCVEIVKILNRTAQKRKQKSAPPPFRGFAFLSVDGVVVDFDAEY